MKIIVYSLIIGLFTLNAGFAQWMVQPSGTSTFINAAYFHDENTGWACANNLVLKTTNGGDNWTNTPVPGSHVAITFTDENNGWICGQFGELLKTTDGGNTWTPKPSGITYHFNDIQFYDQNTGFAVGFGRTFIRTTNGGDNWSNVLPPGNFPTLYSLYIMNANDIYATADLSYIYKSGDGGNTWDSITVGMQNPFFSIYFLNYNTGWALGCCGMYFKTTDAGNSWTPEQYLTPGFTIYSANFINENTGWMSADAGYIMRTTDGGTTWDSLASGTSTDLRTIQFVNDQTGWVVGNEGIILKTTNGGGQGWNVGIQQISTGIPEEYELGQNYPNPFNPSTNINFSLPKAGNVKLVIYDMLGREVSVLVDKTLNAGSFEYNFEAKNLNSGVYFYRLITEDFSQTKKMLLIK